MKAAPINSGTRVKSHAGIILSCGGVVFSVELRPQMTGKPLQLGLAGLGTVGTGVYETLCRNHELLEARAQMRYAVKKVAVRDMSRVRDVVIDAEMLTNDWRELVADPEIDIIIELIGGTTEAYELVTSALNAGKPVVTGNKALLAEYGSELFMLSAQQGVPLYFEASCGGQRFPLSGAFETNRKSQSFIDGD